MCANSFVFVFLDFMSHFVQKLSIICSFLCIFFLAQGLDCCSDNAVSFHYVSPNQMYVLDYLIYHLRPYGIITHSQPLPDKLPFSDIIGDDNTAISMTNNNIEDEQS